MKDIYWPLIINMGLVLGGLVCLGVAFLSLIAAGFAGGKRSKWLGRAVMIGVAGGCLLGLGYLTTPGFIPARAHSKLTSCKSNLKNIATACEMYASDNTGDYPKSLTQLTPNYLKLIPSCPAAKSDTYSARYTSSGQEVDDKAEQTDPDAYTFFCEGNNHKKANVDPNYPQYSSYEGLIDQDRP